MVLSSVDSSPLGTGQEWWQPQQVAGILASSSIETQPNAYLHKLHTAVQGGFPAKEQKKVFILGQEHAGKLKEKGEIAAGDTGRCSVGKRHQGTY